MIKRRQSWCVNQRIAMEWLEQTNMKDVMNAGSRRQHSNR
jgi:hypothetical protein